MTARHCFLRLANERRILTCTSLPQSPRREAQGGGGPTSSFVGIQPSFQGPSRRAETQSGRRLSWSRFAGRALERSLFRARGGDIRVFCPNCQRLFLRPVESSATHPFGTASAVRAPEPASGQTDDSGTAPPRSRASAEVRNLVARDPKSSTKSGR